MSRECIVKAPVSCELLQGPRAETIPVKLRVPNPEGLQEVPEEENPGLSEPMQLHLAAQ